MKPQSISEQMMFNTIRLETLDGSSGTGSYFTFKIGDIIVPIIITNKHVINNNPNEIVTFYIHIIGTNNEPSENIRITYQTDWHFHSSKDICFCYVNPLFEKIRQELHKEIFFKANDESLIPSTQQLEELTALEELVMVGYPIGLWDKVNNFPIFRKGYTASHPALDFNEKGIGLVDMACFPGSSGSPIYILNEGAFGTKKGTVVGSRIILLGYLFAGPQYDAQGNISIIDIPTKQRIGAHTPIMVNLGYYIKSSEILELKTIIERDLIKQNGVNDNL